MCLQVDPLRDVLLVADGAHDELLAEVLVVDDVGSVADNVLDLFMEERYETWHENLNQKF